MNSDLSNFGNTATSLARNPLGIIALFIVLVYGFASMVVAFANSFDATQRLLLVCFLITFPVLVLAVFGRLVSRNSGKLFAPSDFKNEDNYVKMQLTAAASLAVATAKDSSSVSETQISEIIDAVRTTSQKSALSSHEWRNHILWVDDRPDNNRNERRALEAVGYRFTLATSTDEAFEKLAHTKFGAIISDMGRREGPREGYVLLDRLRQDGNETPLFFYAASSAPEHRRETIEHGGQGCTNNARELFAMVTDAVERLR